MFLARGFKTGVGRVTYAGLSLRARRLGKWLLLIIAALVAIGIVSALLRIRQPGRAAQEFLLLFDLGEDSSIPTYFSSLLLLSCASLLAWTGQLKRALGEARWSVWYGLAALFVLLSLDEVAMMHERVGIILKFLYPSVNELDGILRYKWLLVGVPATAFLAILLVPWFFGLSRRLQGLFAASAAIFLGGAIGVEMVNAGVHDTVGTRTATYVLGTAVEECMEMLGAALFLFSLLDHLALHKPRFLFAAEH